jgi:hypothetical protein
MLLINMSEWPFDPYLNQSHTKWLGKSEPKIAKCKPRNLSRIPIEGDEASKPKRRHGFKPILSSTFIEKPKKKKKWTPLNEFVKKPRKPRAIKPIKSFKTIRNIL